MSWFTAAEYEPPEAQRPGGTGDSLLPARDVEADVRPVHSIRGRVRARRRTGAGCHYPEL